MISPADIAALAELYDLYANAFERSSPGRLQARRQFYARLEMLHVENAMNLKTAVQFHRSKPRKRRVRLLDWS